MVDVTRARSFESIGEEYDRYRPGFPERAADIIVPDRVATALDLGAGTGKFTGLLVARATQVIAIEPSAPMLAVLARTLPTVDARPGLHALVRIFQAMLGVREPVHRDLPRAYAALGRRLEIAR